MTIILKNSLALAGAIIVGSIVNMALILIGGAVIPLPSGVDGSNMESLKAGMHLFETKHFVFPFLAHALGTLAGAFVAAWLAVTHKKRFAFGVGVVFLAGGISNVVLLPSPVAFAVVDLLLAYIPMGLLGYKLYTRKA